jgi:hypothetical protein
MHAGLINLSPSYQRDVVWTDSNQSALVESLLLQLYVPPIIFAVKGTQWTCVDGKQRLTSIRRFIDSEIPFYDRQTKTEYWWDLDKANDNAKGDAGEGEEDGSSGGKGKGRGLKKGLSKKTRAKQLPAPDKMKFEDTLPLQVEYSGLTDQDEREASWSVSSLPPGQSR